MKWLSSSLKVFTIILFRNKIGPSGCEALASHLILEVKHENYIKGIEEILQMIKIKEKMGGSDQLMKYDTI